VIRYAAVFCSLHLVCSLLLGYFTWWRESHGGVVGGGTEILSIFAGVQAATAYFVRREARLPTNAEVRSFLLQSCSYVLLFHALIFMLLSASTSKFEELGWLMAASISVAITFLGFWASRPAAFASMNKYLERRSAMSPNTSLERTRAR